MTIKLTGETLLHAQMVHNMISDLGQSLGLAVVIITLVMLIEFRSWRFGPICLIPNIFPLVVISTCIVLSSQPFTVADAILFTICLGIAVDDTIHFISRYRQELRKNHSPEAAILNTFHTVGKAIISTTLIFVFSFAGLFFSALKGYHHFGFYACVGFVAALAGDVILLPALLLVGNSHLNKTETRDNYSGE